MPKTAKIKTKYVNLRLIPFERITLEHLALQEHITLSAALRSLMREGLEKRGVNIVGINSVLTENGFELSN